MEDETLAVPELNLNTELADKVESLVDVLQSQLDSEAEQKAENDLKVEEQLLLDEQLQIDAELKAEEELQAELEFRESLLLSLSDLSDDISVLNTNTLELIEQTEHGNTMSSELYPVAKMAGEWLIISIVVAFLLWVSKQLEDIFNAAFR